MNQAEYEAYLKTEHWRLMRLAAIDRAAHRCQICNSAQSLQVHHRTYERVGRENAADLTVLCARCHEHFHGIIADVREQAFAPSATPDYVAIARGEIGPREFQRPPDYLALSRDKQKPE